MKVSMKAKPISFSETITTVKFMCDGYILYKVEIIISTKSLSLSTLFLPLHGT
jgi:hypothetical protein